MSNKVREYQVVVVIAGVASLKTDYLPARKGYADLWFRNVVEALKDVEGEVVLYSREVPAEPKLEQKFRGDE